MSVVVLRFFVLVVCFSVLFVGRLLRGGVVGRLLRGGGREGV